MKVFEEGYSSWPSKVNFADQNNVVVGYDLEQNCCETAGWFLTKTLPCVWDEREYAWGGEKIDHKTVDLDPYVFDTAYFNEHPESPDSANSMDSGGAVAFRLTNGTDELFLVLYNIHNGYYSHGFTVEVGGVKVRDESI